MAKSSLTNERRLSILLLVVAAHHRLGQLVDRELAADGVEPADYALLSFVGVRAPVRLTEVASELGMPLTTVSDAVKRLEARGHVVRAPNPADRRSMLVELSADGDREWRQGWPALRRINAGLERMLDDSPAVRRALNDLNDAFDAALTEL
jgi:DNA-binding MarR family transcriptional regulator